MRRGTVHWFNSQMGFGYIAPDDGGAAVFVHISAVDQAGLGSLDAGQQLGFVTRRDLRSGKITAAGLQCA